MRVYAFDGTTYTGYNRTTDAQGRAFFTLPQGDYRFRADYEGVQYWSSTADHCALPGCQAVTVVVGPQFTPTQTPTPTLTPTPTSTPTLTPTQTATPISAPLGAGLHDDSAAEITYTCMNPNANASAYNGSLHIAGSAGCSAEFRIDANVFRLFYTQGSTRGEADIYVDGVLYATIDQYSPVQIWQQSWTSGDLGPGPHTILVAQKSGEHIDLDAIRVMTDPALGTLESGVHNDASAEIVYSGFSAETNASAYNDSLHVSTTVGSDAEFTIDTYRFRLTYSQGSSRGEAAIYVDGALYHTLDQYADTDAWQQIWTSGDLGPGPHTVCIEHASGASVDLDAVTVLDHTTPLSLAPGIHDDTSADILYEAMIPNANANAYNGTLHISTMVGGNAVFTIDTNMFRLAYAENVTNGEAEIYVDGVLYHTLNQYGPTLVCQLVWESGDLGPGPHTIRIVHKSGTYINIDAITAVDSLAALPGAAPVCAPARGMACPAALADPVTVTVLDTDGNPAASLRVYAFDGTTYSGYSATTNADGLAVLSLPDGDYRFRADLNGTQFWSGATNHCTVPGCAAASVTVTIPLTVTVRDTDDTPKPSIHVYAFDGATYTGYNGTTDAEGRVSFTLPEGDYRFRADLNGTQFWSGEVDHCTLPGCTSTSVTVTIPLSVTVHDTDGAAVAGLSVYAFDGSTYTGYHGTTDSNGHVTFTLPQGDYRFRVDRNGTQFWSGATNHCALPGCTSAAITVTNLLTVTVQGQTGQPYAGLRVFAFDGTSYTGYNSTTDATGSVVFTLPQGSYRFRADYDGVQFWSGSGNTCTLPGCVADTVVLPGGMGETSVTIDYTYDDLYRLTAADYSSGDYYHYVYDPVGNRLVQETTVGGQLNTDNYTYDTANRLTAVDGVAYTWDANGNLLSDGVNAYTYDSANRMTAVSGPGGDFPFAYNGTGDRLGQVIDGLPIYYTLDLNSGLTQVLGDGAYDYIYGNGRIAQVAAGAQAADYFLTDALDSVRQLTDAAGAVTYAAAYTPYGEVQQSYGTAATSYGFTGEISDTTGMVYLRARYYSPAQGRFTTRDMWEGDYNQPLYYNRWVYAADNPVNYSDPTGKFPASDVTTQFEYLVMRSEHPEDFNPNIPPPLINWFPSVQVNLASQLQQNVARSQYTVNGYATGQLGLNLCGQTSLSMILETVTGTINTLHRIWAVGTNSTVEAFGLDLLAQAVFRTFPQGFQWQVRTYSYNVITRYSGSYENMWREQFGGSNWYGDHDAVEAAPKLRAMLMANHYVIAGVEIEAGGGNWGRLVTTETDTGHWIVLTAMSSPPQWDSSDERSPWNWVRINNPFANRVEYYPWWFFKASFYVQGLPVMEIWPGQDHPDLKG